MSASDGTTTETAVAEVFFRRGDEVELAQRLIADLHGQSELTVDEDGLWQYCSDAGIWTRVTDAGLESRLAAYAGAPVGNPRPRLLHLSQKAMQGAIKIAKSLVGTRSSSRFKDARTGVAFTNGFVTVCGGQIALNPHHSSHLARHAFPFPGDPHAPHPRLGWFFSEVFADADPIDAQQRTLLIQEYVGTSLIGEATRHQKMIVFEGSGANGKSTALDILSGVFPPGSVSSLAPHDWGSKFRTAALAGKLINVVNEIPEGEIVASAVFKSVISGEPIMAENKLEKPFSFRPIAGHIFSANSLPATSDHTQGFWRRLLVVPFTRDMTGSPHHRPNVAKDVLESELPGVVAWALEGAARVQRQGGYTKCTASDWAIDRWRQDVDPVRAFIRAECVVAISEWTSSAALYAQYDRWTAENGFMRMSSAKFFRRLNALNIRAQHSQQGNGYRVRVCVFRPRP